jgi:hypothetical protein
LLKTSNTTTFGKALSFAKGRISGAFWAKIDKSRNWRERPKHPATDLTDRHRILAFRLSVHRIPIKSQLSNSLPDSEKAF